MTVRAAGWTERTIGELCLPVGKIDPVDAGRTEIKYVDIGSVDGERQVLSEISVLSASEAPTRARQVLSSGDTVFSTVRPYLRKIAYIDDSLEGEFASTGFAVLRPRPEVLPRYLFYYATSPSLLDQVLPHQRGVSYPAVRDKDVLAARIPLPPIDEQRRIVEILEDHLSRLDAAEQIVTSAERRLLGWRKSWLDRIVRTNASSRGPLRDLVDRIEAGKSFGGSAPPARDGRWGVIKVSAMTWGQFRAEENKAVSGDRIDTRFEIRTGDVLVSRANTTEYVGAPVLVEATPPRLLLSDKSLRLVPREGVDPRWLVQVLASPTTRRQISARATGTKDSMRNIPQAALLAVTVPVATVEEQGRVIALAGSIDDVATTTFRTAQATVVRSVRLRRALLAAAFAGQLSGTGRDEAVVEDFARV